MKNIVILVCLAAVCSLSLIFMGLHNKSTQPAKTDVIADRISDDSDYYNAIKMSKQVDLDLDKESAIQIAEIILVKVYGKEVLNEKPWNVTTNENIFKISGTLPKGYLGGVAVIEINKINAQVISIIHWK